MKKSQNVKKFGSGLKEAVFGALLGLTLTAIVSALAQEGIIPAYSTWIFGAVSMAANLASLNSFRSVGIFYAVGWVLGSLIFKDILSPVDFAFNIACPFVLIIARAYSWVKSVSRL